MTPLGQKVVLVVSMALLNTHATGLVAGILYLISGGIPVSDLDTHEQQHPMMNLLLPVDTNSNTNTDSGTGSGTTGADNSLLEQDTGLQMKAGDVFQYPHCIKMHHLYSPVSQPTATFRVSEGGFSECFEYCQLAVKCDVFSYDHLVNNCSLHRNTVMTERSPQPSIMEKEEMVNPFKVIASKDCLQCLESVESVFTASYGVKLEQAFMVYGQAGRCLSVSSTRTNGSADGGADNLNTDSYILEWMSCSKANTWVITQVGENKTSPAEMGYHSIRVSLYKNLQWSLESRPYSPDEESFFVVYLARTDSDKAGQVLNIRKSRWEFCEYEFATTSKSSDWYWSVFTVIRDDGYNHYDKNLNEIRVVDAGPQHKICPIESILVKNGKVTNEEKVPFFLEGSTVKIQCNKGYKLNSTHGRQILSCSKRAGKLTPCVAEGEILGERLKEESIYISIIILLFALLVFCTFNQPWSKICSVLRSKQVIDPHLDSNNKSDQNNEIHMNMLTSSSDISNSRSKSPAAVVDNTAADVNNTPTVQLHDPCDAKDSEDPFDPDHTADSATANEPNCRKSERRLRHDRIHITEGGQYKFRSSTNLEAGQVQLAEEAVIEAEAGFKAEKEGAESLTTDHLETL